MTHVFDHIAHAALRGFVYRIMYHCPLIVAGVLFVVAVMYLSRRYP